MDSFFKEKRKERIQRPTHDGSRRIHSSEDSRICEDVNDTKTLGGQLESRSQWEERKLNSPSSAQQEEPDKHHGREEPGDTTGPPSLNEEESDEERYGDGDRLERGGKS